MNDPRVLENMYVPPSVSISSGEKELTFDRGCGHAMTVKTFLFNGRIDAKESQRIKAEMAATPCPECAKKEKEHAQLSGTESNG